jgi:hypothetical protein
MDFYIWVIRGSPMLRAPFFKSKTAAAILSCFIRLLLPGELACSIGNIVQRLFKTPNFFDSCQNQPRPESQAHGLGDVACVLTASGGKISERGKEMVTVLLSHLQ